MEGSLNERMDAVSSTDLDGLDLEQLFARFSKSLDTPNFEELVRNASMRQEAVGIYQRHGASEELAKALAISFPLGFEPKDSHPAGKVMTQNAEDFMLLAYDLMINNRPAYTDLASPSRIPSQAKSYIDAAVGLDQICMKDDALSAARATVLNNFNDAVRVLRASKEAIYSAITKV